MQSWFLEHSDPSHGKLRGQGRASQSYPCCQEVVREAGLEKVAGTGLGQKGRPHID